MVTLYAANVRFMKKDEGHNKMVKVAKTFLFNAITFTEAETLAYKILPEYIEGEFAIANLRKVKAANIFIDPECEDKYYKVVIEFSYMDELTGRDKMVKETYITNALNITDAGTYVKEKAVADDAEVVSVTKYDVEKYIDATIKTADNE